MKTVVNYLSFILSYCGKFNDKFKSNDKFLNSIFQFIKNMKWHFGYTGSFVNIHERLFKKWILI